MTKVNKVSMQAVGYYLMTLFGQWNVGVSKDSSSAFHCLNSMGYTDYHDFYKIRIPYTWYQSVMELLNIDKEDLLVEVARVKGNHAKDLHYHKISHALCIILGPESNFPDTKGGLIQIENNVFPAIENKECYFPSNCSHTFHGGEVNDLYFLSIQSPPLLSEENDDFYLVNK